MFRDSFYSKKKKYASDYFPEIITLRNVKKNHLILRIN